MAAAPRDVANTPATLIEWGVFLSANRYPPRIKAGAGFRPEHALSSRPGQSKAWSMRHSLLAVFTLLCALALPLVGGSPAAAELQPLEIATKNGVHVFAVEMASTPEEQAKGLMFRRQLPEGQGMLFDFHQEQPTSFWMKNTYIPLDMIFIRGDGRILRIAENTVPLSEALVPSGGPVRAVLEVVAGTAKKLGIAPGDRVAHPIFSSR
jgi:hypothetical protein